MSRVLCDHATQLTALETVALSLDVRKVYYRCGDTSLPNKGRKVSCSCQGCNSKCKGYTVDAHADTGQNEQIALSSEHTDQPPCTPAEKPTQSPSPSNRRALNSKVHRRTNPPRSRS